MLVIGANPTDGHPVFASRMKRRLREGARLIVADPRRIDLVRTPHVEADYHLALQPGTNVALLTAMAHVVVTEGLVDEDFVRARCDWDEFQEWAAFVARPRNSPEATAELHRRRPGAGAGGGAALRHRRQRRDLLRPRRHRAQPGLDHGDGDRQPGDGDRQHRPAGRRGEPAARPEQRAGRLRHGLASRTSSPGYRHVSDAGDARAVREGVGLHARHRAGPAHPEHARRRGRGHVPRALHPGRGHPAVRPGHRRTSRPGSRRWTASSCRTCS